MLGNFGIFIDPDGNRRPFQGQVVGGLPEFSGAHGARLDAAIVNVGCVTAIDWRGTLVLKLRPAVTTTAALLELMYVLYDTKPGRVLASTFDAITRRWSELILGDWQAGLTWIKEALGGTTGLQTVLARRRRRAEGLTCAPLSKALTYWEDHRCTTDEAMYRLKSLVEQRFGTFSNHPDAIGLVAREIGSNFPTFAKSTLNRMFGAHASVWPDMRYRQTCYRSYEAAAAGLEPILEDVDAVVFWPEVGYARHRYQRLVLPLHDQRTGRVTVLSATDDDASIDLRRRFARG